MMQHDAVIAMVFAASLLHCNTARFVVNMTIMCLQKRFTPISNSYNG